MLHHITKGNSEHHIVFIHGNSMSLNCWEAVMQAEALSGYTLHAIDLPGHGQSPAGAVPEQDYSLTGLSVPVSEFLKTIKHPFILVALSLGANVAGELTEQFALLKGIVLVSPSIIGKNLQVADIMKPNPGAALLFTMQASDAELEVYAQSSVFNDTNDVKQKIAADYRRTDERFRPAIAASVGAGNYSDELSNIEIHNVPVAVIFGQNDNICFTGYLDKTDFNPWRNKTILLPEAGHMLNYDQPLALAGSIHDFCTEVFKRTK